MAVAALSPEIIQSLFLSKEVQMFATHTFFHVLVCVGMWVAMTATAGCTGFIDGPSARLPHSCP